MNDKLAKKPVPAQVGPPKSSGNSNNVVDNIKKMEQQRLERRAKMEEMKEEK